MLGVDTGKVNVQWHLPSSGQRNHDRHIEFRVILRHILHPVFVAEFLNNRLDTICIDDRSGSEPRLHASRINPNRRILENVLVPLRVRALHGQEIELLAFQHEPNRDRDRAPGLPAESR